MSPYKFFHFRPNSRVDCSRKLYEKMKWNSGIPAASLVGFQHDRFEQVGLKISLYVTGAAYGSVWGVSSHMRGNLEPRLIRSKKSSCQTWLESRDQKMRRKSACQIRSRVSRRSQAFRISFFLLLLLRFLVGQSIYPEFICYRILFFWKICLSDKLALTDELFNSKPLTPVLMSQQRRLQVRVMVDLKTHDYMRRKLGQPSLPFI